VAKPKPRSVPLSLETQSDQQNIANKGASKKQHSLPEPLANNMSVTKVLALDCEMVGIGPKGRTSSLARICVVNSFGNVIYDKFVKQRERVTDYRTEVSGIKKGDLLNGTTSQSIWISFLLTRSCSF
jgi:hypothetical protein